MRSELIRTFPYTTNCNLRGVRQGVDVHTLKQLHYQYNVDGNVRLIFKEVGYDGNSLKALTLYQAVQITVNSF